MMTKYEKLKITLMAIFIIGFIFCLYNYSNNGRYAFSQINKRALLDTRTGTTYYVTDGSGIKINMEEYKNRSKKVNK